MTYEEFLEKIYGEFGNDVTDEDEIQIKWEVGGSRGGNCWGGKSQRYTLDNNEPEFEILDKILEMFTPKISYLQYKKLSNIIKINTVEDREWYGNYTEYKVKSASLQDLYTWLESMGLLN